MDDGSEGRAAVPSGASTGTHEALELRDGEPGRWLGKGVSKAVGAVRGEIARALKGLEPAGPQAVDRRLLDLDGTPNKSRLGANAVLAASMAASRALSQSAKQPLFAFLRQACGLLKDVRLIPQWHPVWQVR